MYTSIRNKNWTEGQMEMIRDEAEVEQKRKAEQVKQEAIDLQCKIWRYGFGKNDAAYDSWLNAAPPYGRNDFLQYCRAEWVRIVDEITLAHKLAGLRFTLV